MPGESDRKRLDTVTRMLCELCASVEAAGKTKLLTSEQAAWWEEHKRVDSERVRRELAAEKQERVRDAALAKLTPAEREALGHPPLVPASRRRGKKK